MKKLLIKVFCGISICTLFMLVGCNNSTSEETSKEMSTAITAEKATAIAPPDKDILLSTPPFSELSTIEAKKEVSKTEPSVAESSIEESSEETESLVESTEELSETKDETDEVEYSYEEEEYIYEDENYEKYAEEDSYDETCDDEYDNYDNYNETYDDEYDNYDETCDDEYVAEDTMLQYDYNAIYTPADFQNMGIINWGDWSWTFYSQQAMPGEGLIIPGRHVDYNGYVCDENDYICLASSSLDKGTVVDTPFGKMGKVYDCGCLNYILDVYVDW